MPEKTSWARFPFKTVLCNAFFFYCLSLCLLSESAFPNPNQPPKPYFEQLNFINGLSNNTVTRIRQDQTGFLWIGTQGGLNRYDGTTFTEFHHDPFDSTTLSSEIISEIFQDSQGRLWIGTEAGLDLFDPPDRFKRILPGSVNYIFENCAGDLYISFWDEGIFILPAHANLPPALWRSYRLTSAMDEDRMGTLWLATCLGELIAYQTDGDSLVFQIFGNTESDLQSGCIDEIIQDQSGRIWFGSRQGLCCFDNGRFVSYQHDPDDKNSLADNRVLSLVLDQDNQLWIGTETAGIDRLDLNTLTFEHFSPSSLPGGLNAHKINHLMLDHSGILWAGSAGAGLFKAVPGRLSIDHSSDLLSANAALAGVPVWCFTETKQGMIWIGSQRGLHLYDPVSNQLETPLAFHQKLGEIPVRDIWVEDETTLWVATLGKGLWRWHLHSDQMQQYESFDSRHEGLNSRLLYALQPDNAGGLWVAAIGGGLFRFDLASRTFNRIILPGTTNRVSTTYWAIDMALQSPHRLWFTTWSEGLWQVNPITQELTYMGLFEKQISNWKHPVLAVFPGKDSLLWIGTYGDGLFKFDPTDSTFTHFGSNAGLADNVIYAVTQEPSGQIWLSSNRGLMQFDPDKMRCKIYNRLNGVLFEEFSLGAVLYSTAGDLYFGCSNGFYRFRPISEINLSPPKIVVQSVHSSNRTRIYNLAPEAMPDLLFSRSDGTVRIDFGSLHYADPGHNQYAYYLQGFDRSWNYIGHHSEAVYTNLPPGEYALYLKSANSDGVWSGEENPITIYMEAPFWHKPWFWALITLIISLIIFLVYRDRLEHIRIVERTRMQEREQLRAKIARDFHDDLGHRLSKIVLFARTAAREKEHISNNCQVALDKIVDNSESLTKEIREFIWELDPSKDSLYELLVQLKKFSEELFDQTEIAFQIKGITPQFEAIPLAPDWRANILRIFKEAMVNILKHAPLCKQVVLEASVSREGIMMRLSNDGSSFDPDHGYEGNGLKNMRIRAKAIDAHLRITSWDGRTTVELVKNYPIG